jgi:uncharacterized protein
VKSLAFASLHRCAVRTAGALRALLLLVASLAVALCTLPVRAQDVLPVPKLSARVIDQTGTLGAKRDVLDAKLAAFEQEAGPQIVILMVPTTQPEDIASFANRVADTWQIGRQEVGDGILIVVAKDDRKQRIEVARALEGAVPDLAARQIMDRVMRPAFRADDYAGGLSGAIDQLEARIRGENLPLPEARGKAGQGRHAARGPDWSQVGMLFFVGVIVGGAILKSMLGRTLGTLATGAGAGALAFMAGAGIVVAGLAGVFALLLAGLMGFGSGLRGLGGPVFWGGGGGFGGGGFGGGGFGGGGFGGGGDGGGGFTSGGGGSFGGGGASSDW